jgi:hypothetical protein
MTTPQKKVQCHCLVCGNKIFLLCLRLSEHLRQRILAALASVTPNSDDGRLNNARLSLGSHMEVTNRSHIKEKV